MARSIYDITFREWLRLHGCDTIEEYDKLPRYPLEQFCRRCDMLKKSVDAQCELCLRLGRAG